MNTKHTPGPWEMNVGVDGAVVYHPDQGTIADIPMDLSAYPHNARLIAAAPDLLASVRECADALADIINAADNDDPYSKSELIDLFLNIQGRAHNAHSKATGGAR